MENVIRVAKRIIPIEQIALIEPFVAPTDPPLRTDKEFKARIVLLDRVSVLSEEAPEELAEAHSFRFVDKDRVATNPQVAFSVEEFEPAENFRPIKPFLSRLLWNDRDGNARSKLMLASPEEVLSIVVRGEEKIENSIADAAPAQTKRRRPTRTRRLPPASKDIA
jgi:hypothetical protein